MLLRRGAPGAALAAALLAACAAGPPPPAATVQIAEAAPTPDPTAGDREPSHRELEARTLDNTEWTLLCDRKCEIDYFELHAGGKSTYHYHDGPVYDDGVWRFEGGTLTISLNNKYATYRARRSGDRFVDGRFENTVGFKFVFTMSRRTGEATGGW